MRLRKILTLALILLIPTVAMAQPWVVSQIMQNAAGATGPGTSIDTSRAASLTLQYIGGSGTLVVEASDGSTVAGTAIWTTLPCYPVGNSSVASSFTVSTTAGMARCNVAGIALVRARISVFSSGPINVLGSASSIPAFSANGF